METRQKRIEFEFVENIPEKIENGILYISISYATAVHKCICGCGSEVITPITPTDWRLIFDGASVSLEPSIGNWSFPCESHYWIVKNEIEIASKWSKTRIERGREMDRLWKHTSEEPPTKSSSEKSKAKFIDRWIKSRRK